MTVEWQEHRRRSVRLKGFDYARAGAYFMTVCAAGGRNLFGEVVEREMRMNEMGKIAQEEWMRTGEIRPYVRLDAFVVMPNHIHGILIIGHEDKQQEEAMERGETEQGATQQGARHAVPVQFGKPISGSLATIIRSYKSAVSRRVRAECGRPEGIWHRNYYEHIIRNDRDWNRVRAYIRENPERWDEDEENPLRKEYPFDRLRESKGGEAI
jgi:putative transposase